MAEVSLYPAALTPGNPDENDGTSARLLRTTFFSDVDTWVVAITWFAPVTVQALARSASLWHLDADNPLSATGTKTDIVNFGTYTGGVQNRINLAAPRRIHANEAWSAQIFTNNRYTFSNPVTFPFTSDDGTLHAYSAAIAGNGGWTNGGDVTQAVLADNHGGGGGSGFNFFVGVITNVDAVVSANAGLAAMVLSAPPPIPAVMPSAAPAAITVAAPSPAPVVAAAANLAPVMVTAFQASTPASVSSMSTNFGPCEWPLISCGSWPTGSEAVTGSAVTAATEVLWAKSAQRYGLCTMSIRPCRRTCGDSYPFLDRWWEWSGGMWPRPLLYQGMWFNIACGQCAGSCSCTVLEEVLLPGPVNTVTEVKINGVVLTPAAYRLDDNQLLVRTDGGRWPMCQDMSQADTENNTFSVTFTWGEEVPTIGKQALGQLANMLARECMGEDCRLPKNITSLVRQGVSITIPEDWLRRLTFVDLFLDYANPHGLDGAPGIYDPDESWWRRQGT